MTPVIKQRDRVSQAAAAELIAAAAQQLIDANAARTRALAAVARKPVRVQDALAAFQAYTRAEQGVTDAEATYMAILTLWGVSRHGLAAAVGCRPATITRRVGQHPLATARGCDLYQLPGGGWGVRDREPNPVEAEQVSTRARNASVTEPIDPGFGAGTDPFGPGLPGSATDPFGPAPAHRAEAPTGTNAPGSWTEAMVQRALSEAQQQGVTVDDVLDEAQQKGVHPEQVLAWYLSPTEREN